MLEQRWFHVRIAQMYAAQYSEQARDAADCECFDGAWWQRRAARQYETARAWYDGTPLSGPEFVDGMAEGLDPELAEDAMQRAEDGASHEC